jgi:hypothetical protein
MFFKYSSMSKLRWNSFCARRLCVAMYLISIFEKQIQVSFGITTLMRKKGGGGQVGA